MKETKPRWASLRTTAVHLDCSVDTVRRYIAAGYIKGYRVPNLKTIRVDLNQVDAMLQAIPSVGTFS